MFLSWGIITTVAVKWFLNSILPFTITSWKSIKGRFDRIPSTSHLSLFLRPCPLGLSTDVLVVHWGLFFWDLELSSLSSQHCDSAEVLPCFKRFGFSFSGSHLVKFQTSVNGVKYIFEVPQTFNFVTLGCETIKKNPKKTKNPANFSCPTWSLLPGDLHPRPRARVGKWKWLQTISLAILGSPFFTILTPLVTGASTTLLHHKNHLFHWFYWLLSLGTLISYDLLYPTQKWNVYIFLFEDCIILQHMGVSFSNLTSALIIV